MIIDCKVKDFDKHPSFTKWFNEMDEWAKQNDILPEKILFEVKESPYSIYGISFHISLLDDINPTVKTVQENYFLDKSEIEKILERFKQIDVNFFRIRVLDYLKFQKIMKNSI